MYCLPSTVRQVLSAMHNAHCCQPCVDRWTVFYKIAAFASVNHITTSTQVTYYQEYVKACVNNLSKTKKSNKGDKRQTAKYSAQKLYEKGVLVEIEKVPVSSFKAVTIEFSSTDQVGVFEVSGKLSGMNIDKINVVFENLLQVTPSYTFYT